MKDYYSLLGVDANATKADIKKNYRRLVTKFHPDKNSDPDTASKFIVITEAYDVLSNPKSRVQYDYKRKEAVKQANESDYLFTTVVPPTENLFTRRVKDQKKRSLPYHDAKSSILKSWRLVMECLYIVSRYTFHILGIALFLLILYSACTQFVSVLGSSIGMGVIVFLVIVSLVYAIAKIAQSIFVEFDKDIRVFSITYRISHNTATLYCLSVFVCLLLLVVAVVQLY